MAGGEGTDALGAVVHHGRDLGQVRLLVWVSQSGYAVGPRPLGLREQGVDSLADAGVEDGGHVPGFGQIPRFDGGAGEVGGLLGPNGAGKTTMMRVLTGYHYPSSGEVRINGHDIYTEALQVRRSVGYLPENAPIYEELTVREYLEFIAESRGLAAEERLERMGEAAATCGIESVANQVIGTLSKGFRQRVGIAQAIIHTPAVVILDEPTVGLDPIQIREIRKLIRDLSAEHSVILSTHILPEVQAICDRVQIINKGELVLADSIDGLTRRMQQATLIVGLHRPPEPATLKTIAGVLEVETLGDGRLRLHHVPDQHPAEALAERAVNGGWGLFELTPERLSLEDIFVQLTDNETTEEAA